MRTAGGSWRCWGSNNYGQLGDGTTTERHLPVSVLSGLAVRQLSLGVYHSCALLTDKTVTLLRRELPPASSGTARRWTGWCPRRSPASLASTQIAAGAVQSCALLDARLGELLGIQLGGSAGRRHDGQSTQRPRRSPESPARVKVVVGANLVCVLLEGGTVSCWGCNEYGQVGDGTTINRTTPTAVPGLVGVNDLVAGENHVCALLTDRDGLVLGVQRPRRARGRHDNQSGEADPRSRSGGGRADLARRDRTVAPC